MKELIEGFAAQLEVALGIAANAKLRTSGNTITNIVVAGMGGSGIGGNLLTSWVFDDCKVPVTVSKSYDIPGFTGPNTLFLACSYSGNTEETTAAAEKAVQAGAYVVAITGGGKMLQLTEKYGLDVVVIPSHANSPRASIGYSFVQLLNILNFHGLTPANRLNEIQAAIDLIKSDETALKAEAELLAGKLQGKLGIFYGDTKFDGVLLRNLQQIAENGKQLSHYNVFPEMNHNELVGWDYPRVAFENSVTVLLRSSFDHPRTSIRMDVCEEIFKKHSPEVYTLTAKGDSFITQSIYVIHLLDWASYYLAVLNNVDPFPVEVINFLKEELSKHA
ncbi:MAG: bifunctional phosphoglucose/phosphomannose isomerase [Bacteroidota bacterium]